MKNVIFIKKAQARHLQHTSPSKAAPPDCLAMLFSAIVAESVNSLYQNALYMQARRRHKIPLANQGTAINASYSPHEGTFSRT
uniref:hypothetical protein n=1 Tax=Pseudomonas lundensis TaxID=86185 RepID=UPI0028D1F5F0|nr:hypothetical protein [Pseudomonas lundensis]